MSDGLPPPLSTPPIAGASDAAVNTTLKPHRRRSSTGLWILGVAGLVVTAAVALVAVGVFQSGWEANLLTSGSHHGPARLRETVLEDNDAAHKILVMDIDGVISGRSAGSSGSLVEDLRDQLERASEDEKIRAVVLRVDSPGGEVLASDEIHDAIRSFQDEHDIPVVAAMGSLAASGGYYVSAPCRWIVAHPLTLTGSIGVIFHGYNYRGLMDKVGVLPDVVKSGKLKDMFSGEQRPEDVLPEEKRILNDLVQESFTRFKTVVREGRTAAAEKNKKAGIDAGRALSPEWEGLADGRILSGIQAHQAGLVDELGDFQKAVSRAKSLAGITEADLISYESPHSFEDFLGLLGKSGVSGRVRLEVPGFLPQGTLKPGLLYFISPLHAH